MIFRKSLLCMITVLLTLCLPYGAVWPEVQPEITGVDVREADGRTEILINSSSPIEYTIYKPDPYSVNIEMQGVSLGVVREKLVFDRDGVMEIIPSAGEGMDEPARLAIALSVPVDPEPHQEGNSLILAFVNPEADEMEEPAELSATEEMAGEADAIRRIDFVTSGDELLLTVTGNGAITGSVFQADNNKIVLDIPGITSSVEAPMVMEPPVKGIRVGQYKDKARMVIDIDESAEYDIYSMGEQLTVAFRMSSDVTAGSGMHEGMAVGEEETSEGSVASGVISPCEDRELLSRKIALDFQDAELQQALTFIADMSEECNIVVSPKVKDKVTIKLKDVAWGRALEAILRTYGLDKRVDGNIMRIASTSDLAKEETDLAKSKESKEKAGDLVTQFYPINFAKVKDVEKSIKDAKILTKRGSISSDERTSMLIIKDVEDNHQKYAVLIERLDRPEQQVSINARIVEVNTDFVQDFGIQWGGDVRPTANTLVSSFNPDEGTSFASGNPFVVNLPAAVGEGAGAALGFGYIGAGALRALDIQLSAMESSGNGKIISNPRVMTMNNERAQISQGKQIPYQTIEDGEIKIAFKDATLTLSVIPHITPDGTVLLDLDVKKDEPDFSRSINGVPPIDTTNTSTRVLISNGDTLVIGGIFKDTKQVAVDGLPGTDLPILKWLFRKKTENRITTELMIFITPQVVVFEKK